MKLGDYARIGGLCAAMVFAILMEDISDDYHGGGDHYRNAGVQDVHPDEVEDA